MILYLRQLTIYIIHDMMEVFTYLNPVIILPYLIHLGYLLWRKPKTDCNRSRIIMIYKILLCLGYSFMILVITLWSREPDLGRGVDLLPFATVGHGARMDAYVVENILLFIPFGYLTSYLGPGWAKGWNVLVLGAAFSFMIELIQYLTHRGYAQTDDLITNAIGAWVGFWIYLGFRTIMNKQKKLP